MARSRGWELPLLKEWRNYRVISPTELAEQSGLALSVISRLEHGARASTPTIDKLCAALGITREQLLHERPPHGPHGAHTSLHGLSRTARGDGSARREPVAL